MKKFNFSEKEIRDFLEEKVKDVFIDSFSNDETYSQYRTDIYMCEDELYTTNLVQIGDTLLPDECVASVSAFTELEFQINLDDLNEDEKLAVLEKINEDEDEDMTLEELSKSKYADKAEEIYNELFEEKYEEKYEEYIEDEWGNELDRLLEEILDKMEELNEKYEEDEEEL